MKNFFAKQQCIFPKAITPLQKAVCGITGVGGCVGLGFVTVKLIYESGKKFSENVKLEDYKPNLDMPKFENIPKLPQINMPEITLNPMHKSLLLCTTGLLGATAFAGMGCWICATATKYLLISSKLYINNFKNVFRGTQCCDMVRATAKFSILGPLWIFQAFGVSVLALMSGTLILDLLDEASDNWQKYKKYND